MVSLEIHQPRSILINNLSWLKLAYMTDESSPYSEVGAFQAKNTFGTLLDRVERGEEITITRHGKPVAKLVPNTAHSDPDRVRAAFDRLRERARQWARENPGRPAFDWEEIKKLRDEGRP
jgi:prevent-host-death family protein